MKSRAPTRVRKECAGQRGGQSTKRCCQRCQLQLSEKSPGPESQNQKRDGRNKLRVTARSQQPENQSIDRGCNGANTHSNVVKVIPASGETGGKLAPRGVLLAQRTIVG